MFGMNFLLGREAGGSIASGSVRRARVPRVLLSAMAGLSLLSGMTAMQPAPAAAAAAIAALPVPLFFQQDQRWGSDNLGNPNPPNDCHVTLASQGCAVTSLAMVYAYFGISKTQSAGTGMDPKIANQWLAPGGYLHCDMNWEKRGFLAEITPSGTPDTRVLTELRAGRPVIAHVHNHNAGIPMHFVVITGWDGKENDYIVNNPDKGMQGTLIADGYHINGFHRIRTNVFTVDDSTSGFTIAGSSNLSNTVGYAARTDPKIPGETRVGAGVHWAYGVTGAATVAANWYFKIPSDGTWALYAWVPNMYSSTLNAKYTVDTGTTTIKPIAQSPYFDEWAPIGTFSIKANYLTRVMLVNSTGETNRTIAFDAIKWEYVGTY